jgi:hypothetical protein
MVKVDHLMAEKKHKDSQKGQVTSKNIKKTADKKFLSSSPGCLFRLLKPRLFCYIKRK